MSSRVLLVALLALAVVAVYLLMLRGWRGRARRQGDLPPPPVPTGTAQVVVGAVPGLFVGTTYAGSWLERVVVHHLSHRSSAELTVATDGVHLDREDVGELFLPFTAIEEASVGDALAGKVMGRDGLLLLTWRLGAAVLTTGFRADDHSQHRRLAAAVRAHLPVRTGEAG